MLNLVKYLRVQLSRWTDERGASAVEYTLLLVMVALVIIVFADSIIQAISEVWSNIESGLTNTPGA